MHWGNYKEDVMFEPSQYQKEIFDFVINDVGDGMVEAVAGSGKTTTLVEVAKIAESKNALLVAFNRHIADTLNEKLEGTGMVAKTTHSLGYGIVSRGIGKRLVKYDQKYADICYQIIYRDMGPSLARTLTPEEVKKALRPIRDALVKIVDRARLTLQDGVIEQPEVIAVLIDDCGVDVEPRDHARYAGYAKAAFIEGVRMAQRFGKIDYTDMIWLPNALDLAHPKYDWLLVDEAQDLNAAQRELVLTCRADGGRMLFVGDPRQAIMAFAGADADSYRMIAERTNARQLPLSICYRCPRSHIELAKEIVPQIEASPGAKEGTIARISEAALVANTLPGDMILSRTTAPLIPLCIRYIRNHIPAKVRGREIASGLITLIRKIGERTPYERFLEGLEAHRANREAYLSRKEGNEEKITVLNDTCEALEACYTDFNAADYNDLCAQIDGMFTDDRATVVLSTVHRAKGLEAERVFIINEEKLPLQWPNQSAKQSEQEWNLRYVALTRAKDTLTFVDKNAPPAALQEVAAPELVPVGGV